MARPILSPTGTTEEPPSLANAAPEGFQIAEDHYEICPCVSHYQGPVDGDGETCWSCKATGYRLTKRILRPTPKPDFSEQTALARLKTKDDELERFRAQAVATVEQAADMFLKLGHSKEHLQTKAAARAMRQEGN